MEVPSEDDWESLVDRPASELLGYIDVNHHNRTQLCLHTKYVTKFLNYRDLEESRLYEYYWNSTDDVFCEIYKLDVGKFDGWVRGKWDYSDAVSSVRDYFYTLVRMCEHIKELVPRQRIGIDSMPKFVSYPGISMFVLVNLDVIRISSELSGRVRKWGRRCVLLEWGALKSL